MKKVVIASVMFLGLTAPSYAWYDAYGGFTCGYMDPLTSILDNIFGPPCPVPAAMSAPAQPVYNTQQLYQPLPPRPVTVQRPVAPMGPGPGAGVPAAYPYGPWGGPYLPCVPSSGCGYY